MPFTETGAGAHVMDPTAYVHDVCNRWCEFAFSKEFHTFHQIFK